MGSGHSQVIQTTTPTRVHLRDFVRRFHPPLPLGFSIIGRVLVNLIYVCFFAVSTSPWRSLHDPRRIGAFAISMLFMLEKSRTDLGTWLGFLRLHLSARPGLEGKMLLDLVVLSAVVNAVALMKLGIIH
jgi:hypothetical protein